MFNDITFLVISSNNLDLPNDSESVVNILKENNARVIEKSYDENNLNYLDGYNTEGIGQIISRTINFIEYVTAERSMIPITTPEWLFDSIAKGKLLNTKEYNPDPKYFMKNCFVCVADNLPLGDKEAIYEGVSAFGGQCLDDLTKYTTHLIALDTTNEKSIIAYSANRNSIEDDKIDIKIVSPSWIYDCFKNGKNLKPDPYLLSDSIQFIDENDSSKQITGKLLLNKVLFISPDYNLSETFKNTIISLIEKNGGTVVSNCSPNSINVYIGKYREGKNYYECSKSKNIIIGNLPWLYFIIVQNKLILPTDSSILHYPFPKQPLQDFKSLRISVTNYSGDARNYLSKIITLIGGSFTKTLTRDNDYLIAAKPKGKKYNAANVKWSNPYDEGIKIVNHVWLEDCYVNWKIMDSKDSTYHVSDSGTEALLGSVKLKLGLQDSNHLTNFTSDNADIDDSMEEDADHLNDEMAPSNYNNTNDINDNEIPINMENSESKEINTERLGELSGQDYQVSKEPKTQEPITQEPITQELITQESTIQEPITQESNNNESELHGISIIKETISTSPKNGIPEKLIAKTPENSKTSVRRGRSAAKKAALKLQNDISDLNEYQKLSKKNKKGYNEEFEINHIKRNIDEIEQLKEDIGTPIKRSKTTNLDPQIIAIMTGCDPELSLSKTDISKLSVVGIKILSEFNAKLPINTLIAPKLSRTEKFLKSLSKVDRIVHPKYLAEILKKDNLINLNWKDISREFKIDDYSIDKFITIKELSSALGFEGFMINLDELLNNNNKGKLFNGIKLNLSANLNGGVDVISGILVEHGVEGIKTIKNLSSKAGVKNLLTSKDEKVILIANKNKDSKLIKNFKKFIPDGYVISWDWCVKSIFSMELVDFDEFYL